MQPAVQWMCSYDLCDTVRHHFRSMLRTEVLKLIPAATWYVRFARISQGNRWLQSIRLCDLLANLCSLLCCLKVKLSLMQQRFAIIFSFSWCAEVLFHPFLDLSFQSFYAFLSLAGLQQCAEEALVLWLLWATGCLNVQMEQWARMRPEQNYRSLIHQNGPCDFHH